jgi:hypothetical protein
MQTGATQTKGLSCHWAGWSTSRSWFLSVRVRGTIKPYDPVTTERAEKYCGAMRWPRPPLDAARPTCRDKTTRAASGKPSHHTPTPLPRKVRGVKT